MQETPVGGSELRNTASFSQDNFAKLIQIMNDKKLAAGTSIFSEGDPADKLFYVKKGRVKLTKSSPYGKQIILCLYHEGDLFGQLDPFNESTQSFHGETMEDTHIGVIAQKDLENLLGVYGELAVEFMRWMGMMHRVTQSKFRDLVMFGKPGALCSTLIRLMHTYGVEHGSSGSVLINKKVSHTEIAELIGSTRESVNRMLADLKDKGVISIERHHYLVIHDIGYLRDICHCDNCPKDICRI